jgi:DNA modification methylase
MRILLADNRTAEKAEREPEPLADLLQELEQTDDGLEGTGYIGDDLDELLDDLGRIPGGEDVDDPGAETSRAEELQEEWGTERGQLWQVGRHRLLCGDSTDEGDVERLLDRGVEVCFTSPPYALGDSVSLSNNTHIDDNPYESHEDTAENWRPLIDGFMSAADQYCDAFAINLSLLAGNKQQMLDWVGSLSDRIHDIAIWSKPNPPPAMAEGVLARGDEWCIVIGDEGASRAIPYSTWRGEVASVYEGAGNYGNEYSDAHAATMPVEFAQWVIGKLMDSAKTWYDPFAGTGTTIIAAEQEGRTCYAMEIDPGYCAVILERCSEAGMECELIE